MARVPCPVQYEGNATRICLNGTIGWGRVNDTLCTLKQDKRLEVLINIASDINGIITIIINNITALFSALRNIPVLTNLLQVVDNVLEANSSEIA